MTNPALTSGAMLPGNYGHVDYGATNNPGERVNTALYVAASSMQYQVEH